VALHHHPLISPNSVPQPKPLDATKINIKKSKKRQ